MVFYILNKSYYKRPITKTRKDKRQFWYNICLRNIIENYAYICLFSVKKYIKVLVTK